MDDAEREAADAIVEYFHKLVLETETAADIIVRTSSVGAILMTLDSLLDYHDLTLNGGTGNIRSREDYVPVLERVIVQ